MNYARVVAVMILSLMLLQVKSESSVNPQRSVPWRPHPYEENFFKEPSHQEPIFNVRNFGAKVCSGSNLKI